MKLVNKIEKKLWDIFPDKKYVNVENYIKYWYIGPEYDYRGNLIENENFSIVYQENSHNINLIKTLSNIRDEEILLKIAVDLGIEIPDTIPAVVEIKEILANDYTDVAITFNKAYSKVYEEPSLSIILANSALEAIIKKICKDQNLNPCKSKDTLYDLISHILKEFKYFPNAKLDNNIRQIGSSLLSACQAIESIRSDNTEGHGKLSEDYIINDPLYSMFILNSITTVGLFLLNYYEKEYKTYSEEDEDFVSDNEIPF